MARERGWKCLYCESVYVIDQLDGMGSPPSCPKCQQANPGSGRYELRPEPIEVDRNPDGTLQGVVYGPASGNGRRKNRIQRVNGEQPLTADSVIEFLKGVELP